MYKLNVALAIGGGFSWTLHSAEKLGQWFQDCRDGEVGRCSFSVETPSDYSKFTLSPTGENRYEVLPGW